MPRYRMRADVPAGTAQSDAVTEEIEVEQQVIEEGLLFVPPGADDTVRAELRFGEHRLLPTANSTPVLLANVPERGPINLQLPGVPTVVTLIAWAPNSSFQHTVTAAFNAVQVENAVETVRVVGESSQATTRPTRTAAPAEDLTENGTEE